MSAVMICGCFANLSAWCDGGDCFGYVDAVAAGPRRTGAHAGARYDSSAAAGW